jgi:hypothetical protein
LNRISQVHTPSAFRTNYRRRIFLISGAQMAEN